MLTQTSTPNSASSWVRHISWDVLALAQRVLQMWVYAHIYKAAQSFSFLPSLRLGIYFKLALMTTGHILDKMAASVLLMISLQGRSEVSPDPLRAEYPCSGCRFFHHHTFAVDSFAANIGSM